MHELTFTVEPRSKDVKAKDLLKAGKIPAVVYGPDVEPMNISLDKVEVVKHINHLSETTIITLAFEEDNEKKELHAFLKAVQRDRVSDAVMHLDFYVPSKGHKMEIHVPINLLGKAKGVEKGGILEHIVMNLPVEVLPKDVVDSIDVDVTHLDLGDVLRVKDLPLPEGIKPLLDPEEAIAVIETPRAALVETVEEVEEEVEPEVIEKGKKEEEE
ncbi:50S ribosomal protein L25 [Kosmotoga arenicorallina S304]|uniref:Large ribosomal subunit protein bL25 n=1 Tax=Kosmotoga arenicorallina S304 TaxID=1453497 RepID=A0A176K022_9BACT|nr:50S ribosomal protein L25 [Kosmotoga arenicorallina]OAA29768.1 50S ribosomal protein L25 [Kosmotoga arenicorallina S304]